MNEPEESGLEQISDTIETLVTGVPAPIRKNFFKAFGQLCTAAVDIPVAKLQSKADEIRAESTARIKIIEEQGKQISDKLNVPEQYISKASEKFASRVVKEQLNLDDIGMIAASNLKNTTKTIPSESQSEEISDDWLNEFENYAKLKSSEDMKLVFGKILSGEITRPGKYSIRTVRLISQLDNQAARIFQSLCSQSISMQIGENIILDARVVTISGNAGSNGLSQYGLSFDNLNILQEYGLIITDYNAWRNYNICISNEQDQVSASMCYANKHYALVPTDKEKYDKILKFNGIVFTNAGKELLSIMTPSNEERYLKNFQEYLDKKFLKMVEIKI